MYIGRPPRGGVNALLTNVNLQAEESHMTKELIPLIALLVVILGFALAFLAIWALIRSDRPGDLTLSIGRLFNLVLRLDRTPGPARRRPRSGASGGSSNRCCEGKP